MGKMKANRKFVKGEEAVSAVIGVILMVAITVAIAATVYIYVSGMLPSGGGTTPTVSMTADPTATHNCTLSIGTTTPTSVDWAAVTYTLTDLTASHAVTAGTVASLYNVSVDIPTSGQVTGGQIITLKFVGSPYTATYPLASTHTYRFTLVYKTTKGTMGTVSWAQP